MGTIINIMKMDIVLIFSKKGGQLGSVIAMLVFGVLVGLIGLFAMPDLLAYYLVIIGIVISPMIINQETKSESAKALCVIPTDRKTIVLARYSLAFSIYTAVAIVLFALMKISINTGFGTDGITFEIIRIYLAYLNMPFMLANAISNVIFFLCYMIGIILLTNNLRSYFQNGAVNKNNSLIKKVLKVIFIYILLLICGAALIFLCTIPIIQTAFNMIVQILISLSVPADGILLSVTLIIIGLGILIYQAVCSVIEYDAREL